MPCSSLLRIIIDKQHKPFCKHFLIIYFPFSSFSFINDTAILNAFILRTRRVCAFPVNFSRIWFVLHRDWTKSEFHTATLFGGKPLNLLPRRIGSQLVISNGKRPVKASPYPDTYPKMLYGLIAFLYRLLRSRLRKFCLLTYLLYHNIYNLLTWF